MADCAHWSQAGLCGNPGARLYISGPACLAHTPAALAGRPETIVDPALTLDGIRAAKRITAPQFLRNDSSLIDQRAVASGRRRSNPQTYRVAQTAEDTRRAAERERRRAHR